MDTEVVTIQDTVKPGCIVFQRDEVSHNLGKTLEVEEASLREEVEGPMGTDVLPELTTSGDSEGAEGE